MFAEGEFSDKHRKAVGQLSYEILAFQALTTGCFHQKDLTIVAFRG